MTVIRVTQARRFTSVASVVALISALLISTAPPAAGYTQEFAAFIGKSGTGPQDLYHPYDVTTNEEGTEVFVLDQGMHRIQVFNRNGKFLRTIGEQGSEEGQLYYPEAIAMDTDGDFIYVADTSNNRIQVFDSNTGAQLQSWGEPGSDPGQFNGPNGISVSLDNVFVTDKLNARVQVFTKAGTFVREWGHFGSDNGEFIVPTGIEYTSLGVAVTDEQTGFVQIFDPNGAFIIKFGGKGTADGQLDFPDEISACAVDDGLGFRFYVAEAGNTQRVSVFRGNGGNFIGHLAGSENRHIQYPHGVFCSPEASGEIVYTASTNEGTVYAHEVTEDDAEVEIQPFESARSLIKRKALVFQISHNGFGKCKLDEAAATLDIPPDKGDPFSGEKIQFKDSGLSIPQDDRVTYELKLPKRAFQEAKEALEAKQRIQVHVRFKFANCPDAKANYSIPTDND